MDLPRCPFEKPILSNQCRCSLAERAVTGERVTVRCTRDLARANCQLLIELLRENAKFVLKVAHPHEPLAFGKEMRLMVGGVRGLAQVLGDGEPTKHDVNALVNRAQQKFGSLASLPFTEIVRAVAATQPKRRGT